MKALRFATAALPLLATAVTGLVAGGRDNPVKKSLSVAGSAKSETTSVVVAASSQTASDISSAATPTKDSILANVYNQIFGRGPADTINTASYTDIGQTVNVAGGTFVRESDSTISVTGSIKCDASGDSGAKTINSVDNRGTIIPNADTVEVHNAADTILKAGQHNDKILISDFDATKDQVTLQDYTGQITVSDPKKRDDVPALADKAGDHYVQTIQNDGKDIAFIGYENGQPIGLGNINLNGNAIGVAPTSTAVSTATGSATASSTSTSTTASVTASQVPDSTGGAMNNAVNNMLLFGSLGMALYALH